MMKISPAKKIQGTVSLPGDKSISHRAAIMAALAEAAEAAEGATKIENFAPGADCASTLSCLKQLGIKIEQDGNTVIVYGRGKSGLQAPAADLDCGNSGSTMRMIAGILAGQNFSSVLTGDDSLSARPMNRIIEPLAQMGAAFDSREGFAPLKIHGKTPLRSISYALPKPSAQLKSCVLLAGLFGDGVTEVIESVPTRDHTERMLPHFGVEAQSINKEDGTHISVSGNARLVARDLTVPADISSAAFFMIAAACLPGSELTLKHLGLNPSRAAVIDVLKIFGVNIEIQNKKLLGREPAGDVIIKGAELGSGANNIINGALTAALIDEIPILAVFGTQLENGLEIRDAQELRIKESDRIKSVVLNLQAMGAEVEEFPDGLRVGRSNLMEAAIDSFHDHRIAMAFAVAGLFADGETEILHPECAGISFPGFFTVLEQIAK
jgi:3-phosphoshikimate 1-carboxyvinyltransferase